MKLTGSLHILKGQLITLFILNHIKYYKHIESKQKSILKRLFNMSYWLFYVSWSYCNVFDSGGPLPVSGNYDHRGELLGQESVLLSHIFSNKTTFLCPSVNIYIYFYCNWIVSTRGLWYCLIYSKWGTFMRFVLKMFDILMWSFCFMWYFALGFVSFSC